MNRKNEQRCLAGVIAALALLGGTSALRSKAPPPLEDRAALVLRQFRTVIPLTQPEISLAPVPEEPADDPAGEGSGAAPEGAAQPAPAAAPEYFSLHFVGDCTLACNAYYQGGPLGYDTVMGGDYAYPFAKTVQYFENDDFTFANLEVALTKSNTANLQKTFVFKADPEYARVMTEGGVEFVSLANNHVDDYLKQGYADTKAAVAAVDLAYAGDDEWTVYETERGLKIGVYALCSVSYDNLDKIREGVKAVRAAGADFVIAAMHWGDEGSYRANDRQKRQAHAAVDAGADFVYGSHPHTLQPMEEYNGVTICYSMGNWTFGGNTNPRDKDTFIYHLTVAKYPDGTAKVADAEIIPCASSGVTDGNNYQPVPYEAGSEGYQRVLSKLDGSFTGSNLTIGYSYGAGE